MVRKTFWMAGMMAKKMGLPVFKIDESELDRLLKNPNLLKLQINSIKHFMFAHFNNTDHKSLQTELASVLDLLITVINGIFDDDILEKGFRSVDHLDLREWLKKHGANTITLNSTFLKFHYDLLESYTDGDINPAFHGSGNIS